MYNLPRCSLAQKSLKQRVLVRVCFVRADWMAVDRTQYPQSDARTPKVTYTENKLALSVGLLPLYDGRAIRTFRSDCTRKNMRISIVTTVRAAFTLFSVVAGAAATQCMR